MGTRLLYLVRHGHYHSESDAAKYGELTALGRLQAKRTGKRLALLGLDVVHHSDMRRAVETAELIVNELTGEISTRSSKLLREGIPTAPVPWKPSFTRAEAREDRARMDEAYARYLRPLARGLRRELLVAHGNIIRYFVRRAMGDPVGKWSYMTLAHCGLTVIAVEGASGHTRLMSFNDVGHMPPGMCTLM